MATEISWQIGVGKNAANEWMITELQFGFSKEFTRNVGYLNSFRKKKAWMTTKYFDVVLSDVISVITIARHKTYTQFKCLNVSISVKT